MQDNLTAAKVLWGQVEGGGGEELCLLEFDNLVGRVISKYSISLFTRCCDLVFFWYLWLYPLFGICWWLGMVLLTLCKLLWKIFTLLFVTCSILRILRSNSKTLLQTFTTSLGAGLCCWRRATPIAAVSQAQALECVILVLSQLLEDFFLLTFFMHLFIPILNLLKLKYKGFLLDNFLYSGFEKLSHGDGALGSRNGLRVHGSVEHRRVVPYVNRGTAEWPFFVIGPSDPHGPTHLLDLQYPRRWKLSGGWGGTNWHF